MGVNPGEHCSGERKHFPFASPYLALTHTSSFLVHEYPAAQGQPSQPWSWPLLGGEQAGTHRQPPWFFFLGPSRELRKQLGP
jgi:hypothetical protein